MVGKLTGHLHLPSIVTRPAAVLPDRERAGYLGRVLVGCDLPLRPRVAAATLLLYAQPVSRIVRLTLDDVIRDGDQVLLRLGEPPSPVPPPAAGLLLEWIASRDSMNTATNRNSPWLFPGRRAGQYAGTAIVGTPMSLTCVGEAVRVHRLSHPRPPRSYHRDSALRSLSRADRPVTSGSSASRFTDRPDGLACFYHRE
jgi:hypothetical protein